MLISKKWLVTGFVAVILGILSGTTYANLTASHEGGSAIFAKAENLSEELDSVELIVKGTVLEEDETITVEENDKKTGKEIWYKTPSKFKIDQVLYGEAPSEVITVLQHGRRSDNKNKDKFLKKNDEFILLLGKKTSDGQYWSYRSEDGIWKIKNNKVHSKGENEFLKVLQNVDVEDFKREIIKAKK